MLLIYCVNRWTTRVEESYFYWARERREEKRRREERAETFTRLSEYLAIVFHFTEQSSQFSECVNHLSGRNFIQLNEISIYHLMLFLFLLFRGEQLIVIQLKAR